MKYLLFIFVALLPLVSRAASTAQVGDTLIMSVSVGSGTSPFVYKWFKNGVAINNPSTTPSIFTITGAQLVDAGSYTATISNSAGSTTTPPEVITITAPPPPVLPPTAGVINTNVVKKTIP